MKQEGKIQLKILFLACPPTQSLTIASSLLPSELLFLSSRSQPLEKERGTHSNILAQKIPWLEKPGGLQSMGSLRVGQTNKHTQIISPSGPRQDLPFSPLTSYISSLDKLIIIYHFANSSFFFFFSSLRPNSMSMFL